MQQSVRRFQILEAATGARLESESSALGRKVMGWSPDTTKLGTEKSKRLLVDLDRTTFVPWVKLQTKRVSDLLMDSFQDMAESSQAGQEMFALEMSHEHTEAFRRGNLSKKQRMQNYQDALWELNNLLTHTMQVEWAPKGGTMLAFLRYGGNSHWSEEHRDFENDDIDIFIGADSETHSQHIMLEITERLKRSQHGRGLDVDGLLVRGVDVGWTWMDFLSSNTTSPPSCSPPATSFQVGT